MAKPRPPSFYDSPEWQRARHTQLVRFPFCEVKGCKQRAVHVDHVITIRAAPYLKLEPSNLQSLCEVHHNQLTNAYDKGTIAGACDENGFPLDPGHPWSQASNAEAIKVVNQSPSKPDARLTAKLKRAHSRPRR